VQTCTKRRLHFLGGGILQLGFKTEWLSPHRGFKTRLFFDLDETVFWVD
jgi:hypothetical protein